MSPASNIYTLYFAVQTGKGSPADIPAFATRVQSANIAPSPERDRIEETGTGRDGGDRYTVRIEVTGGSQFVLRPKIAGLVAFAILGARSTTGAAAPYTHINTPADDQPYLTIWRKLGNGPQALVERFDDCKITGANFTGEAGQNLSVNLTILGLQPRRLADMPVGSPVAETGFPFRVPGVTYTVEGAVNSAIRSFGYNVEANQNAIQTVQIYNSYLEPGLRTISVTYTEVFQTLDRYNKMLYGSGAGTTPSEAIYHGTWKGAFGDMTNGPGFEINVPNLAYMTGPLEPDPGGDPLQMEIAGEADTPASGDITTITVVNDVATY